MRGGVLPQPTRVGVRRMRTKHRRSCLARSESCASCDSNDGIHPALHVFFFKGFQNKEPIYSYSHDSHDSPSPTTQCGLPRLSSDSHEKVESS